MINILFSSIITFVILIILFRITILCITFVFNYIKITYRKTIPQTENNNYEGAANLRNQFIYTVMLFLNGADKYSNRLISKIPSHFLRKLCLKVILRIQMEADVVVYSGTIFRDGYKCRIEKGTVIGDNCYIDARGGVTLGENCNLSSDVRIWTAQHDVNAQSFNYVKGPVKIGNRCWISSNVTILPDVNIGEGTVIASGAVVTKDCEAFSVYAGIPARKISDRNKNIDYCFDGSHDWFL